MNKKRFKDLYALFVIFFKAGTFTFAGGLAMLPVIEADITEKRRMMTREEFLEYATLAQSLPGVVALNCASFVGRRVAGVAGMIAAGVGATFSAFALMLLATVMMRFVPQYGPVVGAFKCIRAASAALVLSAAFTLGKFNIKSVFSAAVMLTAFVLILFFDVNALLVIAAAGLAGFIKMFIVRRKSKGGDALTQQR